MPAIIANAKDFLINSDYPMDKVVFLTSGSLVLDGDPHSFAHGLPFVPLTGGYWSFSADFSTSYEFYSGDFPSGNPSFIFAHQVDVSSDATNITIGTQDIIGDVPTVYYRIYAFEPSDSNADIASPLSSSDAFALNSDYNYMKLYSSGVANPGTAATYTITHGIGYKPQVHAWYTWLGDTVPMVRAGDTANGQVTLAVNDNTIVMSNPYGLNITRLDYRIYLDD